MTSVEVKTLPMADRRAVGGPVARGLLAAWFAVALAAWIAAAAVLVGGADDLGAGIFLAPDVVLAVHLVALGALPFAVAGASFHLLPVMLRNDLPSQRALWVALVLLLGGFAVAAGLEHWRPELVWPGAAAVAAGLAIVLAELGVLVARAPRGRMLVASRAGVALSCVHVVAALVVGAVLFGHGISSLELLLIHLHVALVGWIALLIVTVGRTLAPMLALAPAAPRRAWPADELALAAGLWLLVGGLAAHERWPTFAGGVAVVLALGRFVLFMARTARARRGPLEAPLAHLLAGGVCLAEAAVAGLVAAAGGGGGRLVVAYVVLLLVGWAGGVVVGHVGKLLSLSLWVWWPPGPRPKQAELHPRRLGVVEAAVFFAAVQALAAGVLAGSGATVRAGAVALLVSAVLAAAGAAWTWRQRPS
ncbi:MAG TPA: hypothetical protein VFL60_02770 [Gaiellaceae bacterium]|nr:hypothetical protein [Gaiellaceae bacterium]